MLHLCTKLWIHFHAAGVLYIKPTVEYLQYQTLC